MKNISAYSLVAEYYFGLCNVAEINVNGIACYTAVGIDFAEKFAVEQIRTEFLLYFRAEIFFGRKIFSANPLGKAI